MNQNELKWINLKTLRTSLLCFDCGNCWWLFLGKLLSFEETKSIFPYHHFKKKITIEIKIKIKIKQKMKDYELFVLMAIISIGSFLYKSLWFINYTFNVADFSLQSVCVLLLLFCLLCATVPGVRTLEIISIQFTKPNLIYCKIVTQNVNQILSLNKWIWLNSLMLISISLL